jgi:hypothetical protein
MTTTAPAPRHTRRPTRTLPSSELTVGMIVHTHGMHVLLTDRKSYPDPKTGRQVTSCRGRVLNRAELRDSDPWLYAHTADGWTVQGNDFVTWAVR